MDVASDNDHFVPETRARSNTWPQRQPSEDYAKPVEESSGSIQSGDSDLHEPSPTSPQQAKKSSHRRNAWGNLSYADLITHAITSSPEGRRTLADIYEWMVANVPYFRDKGDSNSSAGWKNSVRHNLSLHNRFMRVQNETPGKSSWWMINPDPKPGKTARRRAASMETNKSDKKKERIKKKIEALRNGLSGGTLSPLALERSSRFFDSGGSYEVNSELEALGFTNSSYGKLLPVHNEMNMEVEWTKTTDFTDSKNFQTNDINEEMKNINSLTDDNDQKHTPLPPFSTAYEVNLNLLHRNSYSQFSNYSLEDYKGLTSSPFKVEKISPPDSPMFQETQSEAQDNSSSLLRERLVDLPSLSPPFTSMGQFMEALNNNTLVDNFQQGLESVGGYGNGFSATIKKEVELEEGLFQADVIQPQKQTELTTIPTANTPLESLFVNQYRNFVLT